MRLVAFCCDEEAIVCSRIIVVRHQGQCLADAVLWSVDTAWSDVGLVPQQILCMQPANGVDLSDGEAIKVREKSG